MAPTDSKMGRPPSKDPRKTKVDAKLTAEEMEKLAYCCEVTGRTRSDIIRAGIEKIYESLNPRK